MAFNVKEIEKQTFINVSGYDIILHDADGNYLCPFLCRKTAVLNPRAIRPSVFGVPIMVGAAVDGWPVCPDTAVIIVSEEVAKHVRENPREYKGIVMTPDMVDATVTAEACMTVKSFVIVKPTRDV
jgi:hypothetical protein